jgi:hypothetical protein
MARLVNLLSICFDDGLIALNFWGNETPVCRRDPGDAGIEGNVDQFVGANVVTTFG